MRFLLRHGRRTSVGGRFEEIGLDEGRSGKRFPGGSAEDFNVDLDGHAGGQVQDAAEETGLLVVIVVNRVGRLELQFRTAGSRLGSWRQRRLMMVMQRTRTDVDHEVSGQGGDANQAVVQKKHHLVSRRQPKSSPGTSV